MPCIDSISILLKNTVSNGQFKMVIPIPADSIDTNN